MSNISFHFISCELWHHTLHLISTHELFWWNTIPEVFSLPLVLSLQIKQKKRYNPATSQSPHSSFRHAHMCIGYLTPTLEISRVFRDWCCPSVITQYGILCLPPRKLIAYLFLLPFPSRMMRSHTCHDSWYNLILIVSKPISVFFPLVHILQDVVVRIWGHI
jgi:hypothetical protein